MTEWITRKLEDITRSPISYGVVQTGENLENGVPCVRVMDLSQIKMRPQGMIRTSEEIHLSYKRTILEHEDIMIALRGEIGLARIVEKELAGANLTRGIARINLMREVISPRFLIQAMQTKDFIQELQRRVNGSALQEIPLSELRKSKIVFPVCIKTQDKITEILEQWDMAIEKTEALIEAKERQFGWLQKSALDDDFKSYGGHLSDYAGIMKQQKIEEVGDLKPLTVKLHCKGIEANERDVQITLSKKGRPYFQRFSGEFLIGRQNFHNGGFGIVPQQLDGFIASSAITTLEIDPAKLDPKYLFYFFSRKDYYLRIGHIMDGTGQKELSDKQIMKLPVSIPCIDKQKEVVALLDTAQQEITLLKKLADQYRTQKRGLMQKLLSGEWHLKNTEAP